MIFSDLRSTSKIQFRIYLQRSRMSGRVSDPPLQNTSAHHERNCFLIQHDILDEIFSTKLSLQLTRIICQNQPLRSSSLQDKNKAIILKLAFCTMHASFHAWPMNRQMEANILTYGGRWKGRGCLANNKTFTGTNILTHGMLIQLLLFHFPVCISPILN